MTATCASLMGWSVESLMPFMELSSIATLHLKKVMNGSQTDTRTYQEQISQQQTIFLEVMRRVMMELVNEHRLHGVNVTTQMMQVYSMVGQAPVSGRGRKILTSILAEYGTLLYHSKRWADGQSIMQTLLAALYNEQQQRQPPPATTTMMEIDEEDTTSIESVHHMLAEMYSNCEEHEKAMEETKHAGTTFDSHHLRFRILLRNLISNGGGEGGNGGRTKDDQEEEQQEEEMYKVLLHTTQDCMSSDGLTDRGLLSIAHALQKHEASLPNLRFILCDVLIQSCKLISIKNNKILNGSIVRGQIYSNLMSLLSEMTNEDERLRHVASTMQHLSISIKKYNSQGDGDGRTNESSDGNVGSTFITANDLRTSLRCALAVTHASYSSLSSLSFNKEQQQGGGGNDAMKDYSSNDMRSTLMEQIYSYIQSIQQITKYEELSNCRIHVMCAHLNLRRSVYNQEDVLRYLKMAKQSLHNNFTTADGGASTRLVVDVAAAATTTTEEEINVLKCMIATSEFVLCARNNLPRSETEITSMLEQFSKQYELANAAGFFDRLAQEAAKCTSNPGIPMRALAYELECRRRTCFSSSDDRGRRSNSSSSSSSPNGILLDPQAPLHIAQCFRRLIDMCLDNNPKIKWLKDALYYAQQLHSALSLSSSSSVNSKIYPEDELRWLMSTAWNSGLSCIKVGDQQCGEQYLVVAIKLGQMSISECGGGGGGGDGNIGQSNTNNRVANKEEMENMTEYISRQEFKIEVGDSVRKRLNSP